MATYQNLQSFCWSNIYVSEEVNDNLWDNLWSVSFDDVLETLWPPNLQLLFCSVGVKLGNKIHPQKITMFRK